MGQASQQSSYSEERALIEDLQARYLFALDFKDHDLYVTTFTPDDITLRMLFFGSMATVRQAVRLGFTLATKTPSAG